MSEKRQRSCINSIGKLISDDTDNYDEIQSLFEEVCKTWNDVDIKHPGYVASLEQDTR